MNQFIAHIKENNETQSLKEHLSNTASYAYNMAIDLFRKYVSICAEFHDIGKYSDEFQERIKGNSKRVEHAGCGAYEIISLNPSCVSAIMLAYCIAGHHSGIPDGGSKADNAEDATLHGRIKRKYPNYNSYISEIEPPVLDDEPIRKFLKENSNGNKAEIIELFSFFTRYVFSCLVDADFLDTEKFFHPEIDRNIKGDFKNALLEVNKTLKSFKPVTDTQKARGKLQAQAFSFMNEDANIYILNMPTGSGKTLCSVKIALERAIERKKRIIVVIPYTSIIEQTADTLNKIFGQYLPILQHHSNYSFDDSENEAETTEEKLKRASENWDAPFIITTNVQFFESLYHYKGSKLRKLHNLANSIIIFDEIHTLPIKYIQPCIRAIGYITKHLDSEVILLSATMPNFDTFFHSFAPNNTYINLINDKSLFDKFNNYDIEYLGLCSMDKIIYESSKYSSSLIVVNSKKSARYIYQQCNGKKYHLSTYMTSSHRSKVIRDIKSSLDRNEKIIVISTSLIEAGVDLDFSAVFRETAGLDNILQAAGRCNREGKRDKGYVYVFEIEGENRRNKDIQMRANIARDLFKKHNKLTTDVIEEYYNRLFQFNEAKINDNTISNFEGFPVNKFDSIPFRSYAESFNFIDNDTIGIVIPEKENSHLLDMSSVLRLDIKRKLQKYTASVSYYEFEKLLKSGVIADFGTGIYRLTNPDYYDSDTGLNPDKEKNYIT